MKKFAIILSALILSAASVGCSDSGRSSSEKESSKGNEASTTAAEAANDTVSTTVIVTDEKGETQIVTAAAEQADGEEVEVPAGEIPEELIDAETGAPWIECGNSEEAKKISGFDFASPEKLSTFESPIYTATENGTSQVTYSDSASDNMVTLRKAKSSDDISGDHNKYVLKEKAKAGDIEVEVRGDEDMIYCATWKKGDYSYSMTIDYGMKKEEVLKQIEELMKNEK